ncbi:MAG: dolichyl-phosphate beta-glucosyltransferase [Kiritimatiellia bacterium]
MRLSIIIPAHNERKRIRPMLDAFLSHFLPAYGGDVEMIVVVNGSSDGTESVIREYMDRHAQVKMVVIPDRIGKGGALLRGLREAQGELTGFVDADGATAPEEFQKLLDRIDGHGAAIASRYLPESVVAVRQPLLRRIMSRAFNLSTRLLFGLRIADTQCGAKLMRHEVLQKVLPRLGVTQWVFDVDLLWQIRREGFTILEVPTEWRDQPGSKVRMMSQAPEVFYALMRLRLLYSPFRRLVLWWDGKVGRKAFEARIMQGRMLYREQLRRQDEQK